LLLEEKEESAVYLPARETGVGWEGTTNGIAEAPTKTRGDKRGKRIKGCLERAHASGTRKTGIRYVLSPYERKNKESATTPS